MAKYIEKEALLKVYREEQERPGTWSFEGLVNSVPPADVAPVIHAWWIDTGDRDRYGNRFYRCAKCHGVDKHSPALLVPYCWSCGAKMDGVALEGEQDG